MSNHLIGDPLEERRPKRGTMLFVSSARQILTPCVCGLCINANPAGFQTLRLDQSRVGNDHLLPAGLAVFSAQPYSLQVSGCGSTMRH